MTEEEIYGQIADYAAVEARDALDFWMAKYGKYCESPIERVMLAAFIASSRRPHYFVCAPDQFAWLCENTRWVIIAPQVEIERYRVDFAIGIHDLEARKLFAVECDGHEFHERTAEQASRDRSRDRELQAMNVRVFRFTGREIWRKPLDCVGEIFAAISAEYGT